MESFVLPVRMGNVSFFDSRISDHDYQHLLVVLIPYMVFM